MAREKDAPPSATFLADAGRPEFSTIFGSIRAETAQSSLLTSKDESQIIRQHPMYPEGVTQNQIPCRCYLPPVAWLQEVLKHPARVEKTYVSKIGVVYTIGVNKALSTIDFGD